TDPFVGVISPEAIRRSVDLPQPEGPTTVTNSPPATSKVISSRACVPSGKVMPMPRNARAGAANAPADGRGGVADDEVTVVIGGAPARTYGGHPAPAGTGHAQPARSLPPPPPLPS